MTLNLAPPKNPPELKPRIVVFGVGGAGCNAVNNMIRANMEGVECVVANTDSQALSQTLSERKIQLGLSITQGLGAGSRPEIGRAAAEEGIEDILEQLQGAHMVFITAGMGGGTGTGAAPVIARAAREQGLLTVAVVTKPFHFEGAQRMRLAEQGLDELQDVVDTLIVIPNQNLFKVANEKTTFADAFAMADEVLHSGVRGITDLMVMPGLINLDFADIRTVMSEMGKAMMGAGEADGDNRAIDAAEAAISNPLLDEVSMAGARGLLINITGGPDMTLYEVDEAANRVRDEVDPGANIIFGSTFDEHLQGKIRVSVFATGIDAQAASRPRKTEVPVKTSATGRQDPKSMTGMIEEPSLDDLEYDRAPEVKDPQVDMFGQPVKSAASGIEAEANPVVAEPAPVAATAQPEAQPIERQHPVAAVAPAMVQAEQADETRGQTVVLGNTAAATAPAPSAPAPAPVETADRQRLVARIVDPSVEEPMMPAAEQKEEPVRKKGQLFDGLRRLVTRDPAEDDDQAVARDRTPSMTVRTPRLSTADGAEAVADATRRTEPAMPDPSAGESRTVRMEKRPEPAQPAQAAQPAAKRSEEDDMLDIPAFLRRQAN